MTTAARSTNHRAATAFEQYTSGRRSLEEGAVFFLESGDHLEQVQRIRSSGDLLIAPNDGRSFENDRGVIGYSGALCEPGDEMTLNGRHTFELQDYLAAPFISIVGLTLIRLGSAAGVTAFLQDADIARRDGAFVDQLLSSAVLLDSRESFVADAARDVALVRVHVTAAGEYRDGPDGLLLGQIGDSRETLERAAESSAGGGRFLARIIEPSVLEAELRTRPWIGRYIRVLDLIRQWEGSPADITVSGFGGHLIPALDDPSSGLEIVAPDAPFIVTDRVEGYVLVDGASRRRFKLGLDAARIAECLVACGEDDAAARVLMDALDLAPDSVVISVREVRRRFLAAGIDLVSFSRSRA